MHIYGSSPAAAPPPAIELGPEQDQEAEMSKEQGKQTDPATMPAH